MRVCDPPPPPPPPRVIDKENLMTHMETPRLKKMRAKHGEGR